MSKATFAVAPWDMFKAISLRDKLTLVVSGLRVLWNPKRTQELFTIVGVFAKPRNPTVGQAIRSYVQSLYAEPSLRRAYEDRYLPPTPDLSALAALPAGTLGHAFARHMRDNGLELEFYPPVEVVDELSYIEMRVRQTHDLLHVLCGFSTSVPDELGLQAFVVTQMASPIATTIVGGGLLHISFFKPWLMHDSMQAVRRGVEQGTYAVNFLGYRFEDNWERPIADVRRELGLA